MPSANPEATWDQLEAASIASSSIDIIGRRFIFLRQSDSTHLIRLAKTRMAPIQQVGSAVFLEERCPRLDRLAPCLSVLSCLHPDVPRYIVPRPSRGCEGCILPATSIAATPMLSP